MGRGVRAALGRQGGPLGHAEPVLLIGHDESQPGERHPVGDQGVGAHDEVDLSRCQGGPDLLFLAGGHRARQQSDPDPGRRQ